MRRGDRILVTCSNWRDQNKLVYKYERWITQVDELDDEGGMSYRVAGHG